MKIYIINPDNGKPVSIDDWRKDENPTRARILAIDTDEGYTILMSKDYLPGQYTFEEAQKACAEFITAPWGSSLTFRSPTRKDCIDICDARFQGLDEAVALTGGNFTKPGIRHWTCERNTDPRYGANLAWASNGDYGYAFNVNLYYPFSALPVALLK